MGRVGLRAPAVFPSLAPVTALLPDPVPLAMPPGDPRALADLAERLDRAAALLGELGEQVSADAGATPSWTGLDAAAARAQVQQVRGLVRGAADALLRASGRVAHHHDVLLDARRRLARLRTDQDEDFAAAALRVGSVADPAVGAASGSDACAAIDELRSVDAARRHAAAAILQEVTDDAMATASVLAECSALTGGSGRAGDEARVVRHLEDMLPGWHGAELRERGLGYAAALVDGRDVFAREAAARELLPWAGTGAVAAGVLAGLGAEGFRKVLRQLGNGSLSADSALARSMAAVLGAPVPLAAPEVAEVRAGRYVDRDDYRTAESDFVALGMGVVLAAGRGSPQAGPPAATVRGWGRQIIARERAMGSERIVDRVRLQEAVAQPGDPLAEIALRLAEADDPAPAAALLRSEPAWTHLLDRPWDDGGAALASVVERAGEQQGEGGDVAVSAGLRALAVGLGDDGDPAGWTVDRATAAVVAPSLAQAVAARPGIVVEPLTRAVAGEGQRDQLLLRGLGYLSSEPAAAVALDRGMAEANTWPARSAGPVDPDRAVVRAGYAAVRDYGQRLAHSLVEFAAQEQAQLRQQTGLVAKELVTFVPYVGPVLRAGAAVVSVAADADGTWDASPDGGQQLPSGDVLGMAGSTPAAGTAYRLVAEVLGTPKAPVSPPTDWAGLAADLMPGGGRVREVLELGGELVGDILEELALPPFD